MIFIKVNGYMVKNMVTVNYILMMVECSKVNFKTAKYKVNFFSNKIRTILLKKKIFSNRPWQNDFLERRLLYWELVQRPLPGRRKRMSL